MERPAIRTALVGHGYWGSKLFRYLADDDRFLVTRVCDSVARYERAIGDFDAAVVATPIGTHFEVAGGLLSAGKHVLCEKPLAVRTEDCLKLKRLAEDNGVVLGVEYTWTFSKALMTATSVDIGNVVGVELDHFHLGRFVDWDVYWLLASHMLSILAMFVPLDGLDFERRDIVVDGNRVETGAIFFSGGGVRGRIGIGLNYPGKYTKVVVYGTGGTITYEPLAEKNLRIVRYQKIPGALPDELVEDAAEYNYDETNNIARALGYFHSLVGGRAESNVNTAIDITRILEGLCAERILHSD